ncbi:phosphoribosyltransferase-like protein [Halomonas sp. IOP_14]
MTFSYAHSTPNASLPLYWYEDENFSPLVRR